MGVGAPDHRADRVYPPLGRISGGRPIDLGDHCLRAATALWVGLTGLRDHVMWGLYITNFVFFIGISHAGTLISAILRVTATDWRRPVTRLAEGITVFALLVAAPMILADLGRPERVLNVVRYGRLQSPILMGRDLDHHLPDRQPALPVPPLIPDLAILRRVPGLPAWKRRLYGILGLGWQGTERQRALLERAIATMAIVIIPVAVSVHTVVSWIFGMTLRAGWNSTIFGPYFVFGAIFSGIAAVVTAMAAFRWASATRRSGSSPRTIFSSVPRRETSQGSRRRMMGVQLPGNSERISSTRQTRAGPGRRFDSLGYLFRLCCRSACCRNSAAVRRI